MHDAVEVIFKGIVKGIEDFGNTGTIYTVEDTKGCSHRIRGHNVFPLPKPEELAKGTND